MEGPPFKRDPQKGQELKGEKWSAPYALSTNLLSSLSVEIKSLLRLAREAIPPIHVAGMERDLSRFPDPVHAYTFPGQDTNVLYAQILHYQVALVSVASRKSPLPPLWIYRRQEIK